MCDARGGREQTSSQMDEVRSGGSYFSQNDLRVHFGIGKAEKVDLLEIRWPSGLRGKTGKHQGQSTDFVKEGAGNCAGEDSDGKSGVSAVKREDLRESDVEAKTKRSPVSGNFARSY